MHEHQFSRCLRAMVLTLLSFTVVACDRYRRADPHLGRKAIADQHEHMNGIISSLGRDEYHAELILHSDGKVTVFTLGADETRVHEVPHQTLTAYVKRQDSNASRVILLEARPTFDDRTGMTDRFEGNLPQELLSHALYMTIPGLKIDNQRFNARFEIPYAMETIMPVAIADDLAAALYLTPNGKYTEADIEANGRMTAAQRYQGFRAAHNANPAVGEWICPITRTAADPQCGWIIGGETYRFCCPPCIDEFLEQAKASPDSIAAASEYFQKSQ